MCFKKRPSFSELWLSFLSLSSGSSFLLSLLWSPSITLDSRSDSFSSVWGFVLAKMHWLFCFKSCYRVQCVPSSFRPYLWLLTLTLEGAKTLPVSLAVLKWRIIVSREYLLLGLANFPVYIQVFSLPAYVLEMMKIPCHLILS